MAKSPIELDNLSVEELNRLIEEAQAKRLEKQAGARDALIEEMTAKAAQLGLSFEALVGKQPAQSTSRINGRKPRKDTGQPVAVKYRGPDDATWSGRGRMPTWLSEAIKRGKNKEDFAV